jgi:Tol biopolymer transport system component
MGPAATVAPDGKTIAFTAREAATGRNHLWIRALADVTPHMINGAADAQFPFWSPNGRVLGFFSHDRLFIADMATGTVQSVCDAPSGRGGAWISDREILFAALSGIYRTTVGRQRPALVLSGLYRFPSMLPDGQHFLVSGGSAFGDVFVADLSGSSPKRIVGSGNGAIYSSGFLLYTQQNTLLAQRFNVRRLQLESDPVSVAADVEDAEFTGFPTYSASDTGVLAYGISSAHAVESQLTWLDRAGTTLAALADTGNVQGLDLSPDEKTIVMHRHDGAGGDLWLFDVTRGVSSRFTFDPTQENSYPSWTPDGKRIAFKSTRADHTGIYVKAADGSTPEVKVTDEGEALVPRSWSPDGQVLVYDRTTVQTAVDVWRISPSANAKPVPVLNESFSERFGTVSPDGRWIAYYSNETGKTEVYVRPFPSGAGKWQVSTDGGVFPTWRRDGKELFYLSDPFRGSLVAVDVTVSGSNIRTGPPHPLFQFFNPRVHSGGPPLLYAAAADGQRFLVPRDARTSTTPTLTQIAVMMNWTAALRK